MKKQILNVILIMALFLSVPLCAFSDTRNEAQLTKIEKELFGSTYSNEDEIKRADRIEAEIFGAKNSQLSIEKRIEKMTSALGLETQEEQEASAYDLYAPQKTGEGVEYPQIDELEAILLGSVYKTDNIYTRLERLEHKAFGSKQTGELSDRTEALKNHLSSKISKNKKQDKDNDFLYREQSVPNFAYDNSKDTKLQISALENMLLGADYSTENMSLRLSRLENKMFQRNFDDDDINTRIMRLQAAVNAGQSAKYYDNNKFQKYASTGLQAASFILMILAFIL